MRLDKITYSVSQWKIIDDCLYGLDVLSNILSNNSTDHISQWALVPCFVAAHQVTSSIAADCCYPTQTPHSSSQISLI